jgi:hypothetical protein
MSTADGSRPAGRSRAVVTAERTEPPVGPVAVVRTRSFPMTLAEEEITI